MKFSAKICIILCLTLMLQCVLLTAAAEEEIVDTSVVSGCHSIDGQVPLLGSLKITENMQSAVMFEVSTGTLMYAWNADQQLHPAGLVKILTALVAIENGNMTDAVIVKQDVLDQIEESSRTSKLQADEVLTVEQLLYCVCVSGSNDAALVLADHIGGSVAGFVTMMNKRAQEIGCTNSNFTNVHGLHDDQQLSTARDIARILSAATQNEQFITFFGTTHYDLAATNKSESRSLQTNNHMMHTDLYQIYYDQRITGGRTGVDTEGLNHFAATAQVENMQIVSVVMGSASKVNDRSIVEKLGAFGETKELLDKGFDGFTTAQLLFEGQALKQYTVNNGASDVVVGPKISVSAVIPKQTTTNTLSYRYKEIEDAFNAPISEGAHVSNLEIWYGTVCLAQAELFAMNRVGVNYPIVEEKDGTGLGWLKVILILLLVAVLVFVVYRFVLPRLYMSMHKRKNTRHRPRRRR